MQEGMSSTHESMQKWNKAKGELPLFHGDVDAPELKPTFRKRLMSFSQRMIRPLKSSPSAATLRRTMSAPAGPWRRRRSWSLRAWWETCRDWVSYFFVSSPKKETQLLGGGPRRGSWRRLFSRFGRGGAAGGKRFGYDPFSYAQNFDDGVHVDED
ncbi:uncharacterized protein LOC144704209 [Wolffia australiana]